MSKKILGITFVTIGMIMFIMLYALVIIFQADYIKHIVTILGYISVALFATGIIFLKTSMKKIIKMKEKTK